MTVLEKVEALLGETAVGLVGNCLGARTAVEVGTRLPRCAGTVCVLETSLTPLAVLGRESTLRSIPLRAAGRLRRRLRAAMPWLSPRARAIVRVAGTAPPLSTARRLLPQLSDAVKRYPVVLIECGTPESGAAMRRSLAPLFRSPAAHPGAAIVSAPTRGTAGIRPLVTQEAIRRHVVDQMDRLFGQPPGLDHVRGMHALDDLGDTTTVDRAVPEDLPTPSEAATRLGGDAQDAAPTESIATPGRPVE
jgi:hypothetical protein